MLSDNIGCGMVHSIKNKVRSVQNSACARSSVTYLLRKSVRIRMYMPTGTKYVLVSYQTKVTSDLTRGL